MRSVWLISLLVIQLTHVVNPQKLAVNDHLLVFFHSDRNSVRYQCLSSISQAVETLTLTLTLAQSNFLSIATGKQQTDSELYFVAFGTVSKSTADSIFYMTKMTIRCNSSQSTQETVFFDNSTFHQTLSLAFDVSTDGRFALGCTDESLLILDLNTLRNSSHKIFDCSSLFRLQTLKVSNQYVFIAGYSETAMNVSVLY